MDSRHGPPPLRLRGSKEKATALHGLSLLLTRVESGVLCHLWVPAQAAKVR